MIFAEKMLGKVNEFLNLLLISSFKSSYFWKQGFFRPLAFKAFE